jgi:toxin YoeB
MKLIWSLSAWDDYLYWQKHDKKMLQRINRLLKEIVRDPYHGAGKPEPLRHQLSGCWSRRIDQEHRLVYKVMESGIAVVSCRYHYD